MMNTQFFEHGLSLSTIVELSEACCNVKDQKMRRDGSKISSSPPPTFSLSFNSDDQGENRTSLGGLIEDEQIQNLINDHLHINGCSMPAAFPFLPFLPLSPHHSHITPINFLLVVVVLI